MSSLLLQPKKRLSRAEYEKKIFELTGNITAAQEVLKSTFNNRKRYIDEMKQNFESERFLLYKKIFEQDVEINNLQKKFERLFNQLVIVVNENERLKKKNNNLIKENDELFKRCTELEGSDIVFIGYSD